jgi:hypothetical protein
MPALDARDATQADPSSAHKDSQYFQGKYLSYAVTSHTTRCKEQSRRLKEPLVAFADSMGELIVAGSWRTEKYSLVEKI